MFMVLWHLAVYCPLAHMVWAPDGLIRVWMVMDFAGVWVCGGWGGGACWLAWAWMVMDFAGGGWGAWGWGQVGGSLDATAKESITHMHASMFAFIPKQP